MLTIAVCLCAYFASAQNAQSSTTQSDPKPTFTYVERMPSFPGGMDKLNGFLSDHLRYPEIARQKNVEGKVFVKFIVNQQGHIDSAHVNRTNYFDAAGNEIIGVIGDPYGFEMAALQAIHAMPNWIPGSQDGKPVSVYYNLPIRFRLENKTPKSPEVPPGKKDTRQ